MGQPAQPAPKPLQFEVASVKLSDPGAQGSSLMTDRGANFNVTNMPLRAIIAFACNIREFQLSGGPGWIGTEHYDIAAKPERGESAAEPPDPRTMTDDQRKTRDDQLREKVRSLLADRFGLVLHREIKEQLVYALAVAKSGPKLKVVAVPGDRQGLSTGRGRLQGFAAPMAMFATVLSNTVGRPVLDKTGLMEKYDFLLEWTPDIATINPDKPGGEAPPPLDSSGPAIFTALQEQLGLRLDSTKGPVESIVIDRVERPSGN